MNIVRPLVIVATLSIAFLLSSCLKDYDQYTYKVADWEPLLAAPLVSASLGMDDILKNVGSNIIADSTTGLVHLIYESEQMAANATSYLDIPDQELQTSINFLMPPGVPPGDSIVIAYGDPVVVNFPNGESVDSMHVDALFNINLVSNLKHSGKIKVNLPFVKRNGQSISFEIAHIYTGTLPVIINQVIDLTGSVIYLSQGSKGLRNTIQPDYKLIVYGDNNQDTATYTVDMHDRIEQIRFRDVFGRLGTYTESFTDIFDIGLFNQVELGEVDLEEVKLEIEVENSFGLPIEVNPNEIWASSTVNPPFKVVIDDLPSSIQIQAPPVSAAGSFARSNISMSSHDVIEAFKIAPQLVYYSFTATLNPPGTTGDNFILDTSEIRFRFKVDVPLAGKVGGLVMQDTVELDVDSLEEAQSLTLRLVFENTFPIEVDFQAYMFGPAEQITDSLFNGMTNLLPPGIIGTGADKRVIAPGKRSVDITLEGSKLDAFLAADKIILRGRLKTAGQDLVRVYEDYEIKVRMGAAAALRIQIND